MPQTGKWTRTTSTGQLLSATQNSTNACKPCSCHILCCCYVFILNLPCYTSPFYFSNCMSVTRSHTHKKNRLGVRNLRVPLDIGDPKPCTDKGGEPATKIDVIFNPAVVMRAMQGASIQYFQAEIANLAMSWVTTEMKTQVGHVSKRTLSGMMCVLHSAQHQHL
jgi:hypothetical protein